MQLTVKQAAQFLEVPERQIYLWLDEGEIPFSRDQGQVRFNQSELLEWANSRGIRLSRPYQAETEAHGKGLADALLLGGVHDQLATTDRASALRAAVERLRLGPGGDPEMLVDLMLAREAAGSTAVGDGIAIPHVRAPIVLNGAEPAIALCRLTPPIDFGARDGKPVHTLFLIVTPTVNAHLQILARLAGALHDVEFKAAIQRGAPAEEILTHARRLDAAAKAGR